MGLKEYRAKRRFAVTSEPSGEKKPGARRAAKLAFVVQKHRATALHYDFRLEWKGVLLSWAVPKGPSLDPSVKRLAMEVEDHPIEYAKFEGIIPEGEYGGGTVMIWDNGTWTPEVPDVDAALKKGDLKFTLNGKKLKGSWVLVRTRGRYQGSRPAWLLIKHRDEFASDRGHRGDAAPLRRFRPALDRDRAGRGREHGEGRDRRSAGPAEEAAEEPEVDRAAEEGEEEGRLALQQSDRVLKDRVPFRVKPMLATLVAEPFHRPGWVYEEKYDGYRILAYKEGAKVTLLSRNAKDRTQSFREVAEAVGARLPRARSCWTARSWPSTENLVSRFQLLQQGQVPQVYAVFDCLYRDGADLRARPLPERRAAMEDAIGETERLFPSRRLADNGLAAFKLAGKKGFEGMVAKDASAPYIEGRSTRWLKVKVHQEEEFVIVGFTQPGGARTHFGALLLGAHRGKDLVYVGKVGTGFTQKTLDALHAKLRPLARKTPAVANPPREKGAVWVAPKLVAQIAYQEWTADERLRQPVYLGLRDDKKPSEVVMPGGKG